MHTILQCPLCRKNDALSSTLICKQCKKQFHITTGIYRFTENADAAVWEKYWKHVPVYDDIMDVLRKIMNVQLHRYLVKYAPQQSLTLEPGGGSAYVSAMLAEKGRTAYALDYSELPLRIARQKLRSKAVLVQGDLFSLPFRDEVFDVTFNNSTLEHFSNPLDALQEMSRVTKKGKYVFVGVPYTYGPLALYKLKKKSFKDAWDGTTYDRDSLGKLFEQAGLQVVESRTFFFRCFIGMMGKKP